MPEPEAQKVGLALGSLDGLGLPEGLRELLPHWLVVELTDREPLELLLPLSEGREFALVLGVVLPEWDALVQALGLGEALAHLLAERVMEPLGLVEGDLEGDRVLVVLKVREPEAVREVLLQPQLVGLTLGDLDGLGLPEGLRELLVLPLTLSVKDTVGEPLVQPLAVLVGVTVLQIELDRVMVGDCESVGEMVPERVGDRVWVGDRVRVGDTEPDRLRVPLGEPESVGSAAALGRLTSTCDRRRAKSAPESTRQRPWRESVNNRLPLPLDRRLSAGRIPVGAPLSQYSPAKQLGGAPPKKQENKIARKKGFHLSGGMMRRERGGGAWRVAEKSSTSDFGRPLAAGGPPAGPLRLQPEWGKAPRALLLHSPHAATPSKC